MEDVLTQITDPNVVLETITSQKAYLSLKPPEKVIVEKKKLKSPKLQNQNPRQYTTIIATKQEKFLLIECSKVLKREGG